MMTKPALPSAALLLLLLLLPGTLTAYNDPVPIEVVVVKNSEFDTLEASYNTYVVTGGILLGGLNRLMNSTTDFTFTYIEDPNFGPYLVSVNGLAGNANDRTYWELLVRTSHKKPKRLNVGIGCYTPSEGDTIILNFAKW